MPYQHSINAGVSRYLLTRTGKTAQSYNCNGITMEETWSRSLDYILKEFGTPWYLFHRVDLHNELKRLAFEDGPGQPAALKLDCRVVSVVGVFPLAIASLV